MISTTLAAPHKKSKGPQEQHTGLIPWNGWLYWQKIQYQATSDASGKRHIDLMLGHRPTKCTPPRPKESPPTNHLDCCQSVLITSQASGPTDKSDPLLPSYSGRNKDRKSVHFIRSRVIHSVLTHWMSGWQQIYSVFMFRCSHWLQCGAISLASCASVCVWHPLSWWGGTI